jgi:DNA polymerase delta subunit 2
MYFLRLAVLKDYCVNACAQKWATLNIAGQQAKQIERVLDIRQGELGWVVGTIYMDLPLKPNVLEDLARDVLILQSVGLTGVAFYYGSAAAGKVC